MHTTRPPVPTLLASLCLATLSCADPTRDPADASDIHLTATTEHVYTVGALAGEDWETFGNIRSVHFDAAGDLHIFDSGANRMVVVGTGGNHLRTVGTQGEGPGEIQNARAAAVLADGRTVVYDFGNPAAFEIFDRQGQFLESVTSDLNKGVPGESLYPLPDGRLVSMGGPRIRMLAPGEVPDEDEPRDDDHLRDIHIFALDGGDQRVFYRAWNLPPTEADETVEGSSEVGGGISMTFNRMREFNPGLWIGVLSDGRVAVADSVAYEVKFVAMDGTVAGTVTRPVAPEPVTEAIREATRAAQLEELNESGGIVLSSALEVGLVGVEEQMRVMAARQIESMVFTEVIPVIAGMAVDREDRLWIARMGPGGDGTTGPTDIVRASGEYIGTLPSDGLRIPAAFGPGELMAYIDADEMGVETVRVIRLLSLDRR